MVWKARGRAKVIGRRLPNVWKARGRAEVTGRRLPDGLEGEWEG